MEKHKDIVSYDVYELDLYDLKHRMEMLKVDQVIVYGIGNNGSEIHQLFKNIGIKIKYYVDVKGRGEVHTFRGIKVVGPDVLPEMYKGEYMVISPSIHDSIYDWMREHNIPDEKLILPFYRTESICIDYGDHYDVKPSADMEYRAARPESVKATFVTIAYNTPEHLLRRAIESVLRQSLSDLKYLFILNGPTDDTARIVTEYADLDARISIIDMGRNLPWTDIKLLSAIRDNIEGDYCCQLDSDDYYDERFLEEAVEIGERNQADIICVRTCLFCADSEYNPMNTGLDYDWHDQFYFNVVHPPCHIIGHKNIMTAYARSKICSTFWGKLYTNTLIKQYLEYLTHLPAADRELYYRLDTAMTYRILSMAERVFYSDKVLHFSQYSKKNSTFTLAPVEWLMSLWYSYKGLKDEMDSYYKKKNAKAYAKGFLEVHLPWMVGRKGMLDNVESSKYRNAIIDNFKEMISDPFFKSVLVNKRQYMKADCQEFYKKVYALSERSDVR